MVDNEKKEKQQACLRAFNHYFPAYDRNDGVIKQIKEDLEEIKKLTDLEEKYQKADFAWEKHNNNEIYARGHYQGGDLQELGVNHLDTIEKYRNLVQELWEERESTSQGTKPAQQKSENKPEPAQPKKTKQNTSHQTSNQSASIQEEPEEPLHCSGLGCYKEIPTGVNYYYHKTKNDNNKFCSEQCFTDYYGEYCYNCMNKFLIEKLYAPNKNNPKYLLCFNCWEKEKQEQKEWENSQKSYCEHCTVELTGKEGETALHCSPCWEKEIKKAQKEANYEREQNRTEQNRI